MESYRKSVRRFGVFFRPPGFESIDRHRNDGKHSLVSELGRMLHHYLNQQNLSEV
jgi:hypothetical protein